MAKKRTLKSFLTKTHLLFIAWAYADHLDKSTEWMFAYMSDFAEVDYDEVVEFVIENGEQEMNTRPEWYKNNIDWLEEHNAINQEQLENLS